MNTTKCTSLDFFKTFIVQVTSVMKIANFECWVWITVYFVFFTFLAQAQGETQQKLDALKAEVDQRDRDIRQLQKSLKEAETVLSSAIYQAKQKLSGINQANKHKISSEELIKYAHKISASNAVAAPPTWTQGTGYLWQNV